MKYFTIIFIAFTSITAKSQCNLSPTVIYPDTLCPGFVDSIYTQNFDTYQWYKNYQPISGATQQFLNVVDDGSYNYYSVRVTQDTCTENSDTVTLGPITHMGASATLSPVSPVFPMPCLADTFLFSLSGSQGYWLVNDTLIFTGNDLHISYDVFGGNEFKLQGCTNPIGLMCPNELECLGLIFVDYDEDCLGTNVQELVTDKISISPNPTTGMVKVNSNNVIIENIQVYQINGQQIYPPVSNSMIDLTSFSKGVYVVEIKTENGVERSKVMKH